jgi:hypothetical protein
VIEQIYQAAARAGLLKSVRWISRSQSSKTLWVEWRESDDSMLHNLVVGTDITMTGPSAEFAGIAQGDRIVMGRREFNVRDVRQIHDGSETRATLASL